MLFVWEFWSVTRQRPLSFMPFQMVSRMGHHMKYVLVVLLVLALSALILDWWSGVPDDAVAMYVGRDSCVSCHQTQAAHYSGSHHDLAMDQARPDTVLGDFDDAELTHLGVTSRMFRRGDQFYVQTEGPDGKQADFEVRYVLGADPLQQYMVEFDRSEEMSKDEIARLQVLRLCWDTTARRWFYLPPPDVEDEKLSPDDALHWTGITMRWNTSCADCHSTNLKKNFDVGTATYQTTYSEIDVSCEACHGPGSLHVQLANANSLFWDRKRGYALAPLKSTRSDIEIDTCARCHTRRQRVVHAGFRAGDNFYDFFNNATLDPLLYHADGQIRDEVYVHGSFLQSKMFQKGIRCTDCHDPHSLKPKFEDNRLCTSCHQHPASKYDGPRHHQHREGSSGSRCVECHMPETTYMKVDPRRDHSLRVPRPDLSARLGTPNACSRCHLSDPRPGKPVRKQLVDYGAWVRAAQEGDQEVKDYLRRLDKWSAEYFQKWYGTKDDLDFHYATTISRARAGDRRVEPELIRLATDRKRPGIVRATALTELGQFESAGAVRAFRAGLRDRDVQVRSVAAGLAPRFSGERRAADLGKLLQDPRRLVRTEAARVLSDVPPHRLTTKLKPLLAAALSEYQDGLLVENDRVGAHLMLGVLHENQRQSAVARGDYERALRLDPTVTGPRAHLADLLERDVQSLGQTGSNATGRTSVGENTRTKQLQRRVEELRREELVLYARDARLLPGSAALQYRWGSSLYLNGQIKEATTVLERAVELAPRNPQYVLFLTLIYQKQQRFSEAVSAVNKLVALRPGNASFLQLQRELRQQITTPKRTP